MTETNRHLIEALRRARQREPWTVNSVVECASDPRAFKERTPLCSACSEPCGADEVCATAVAKSAGLFEWMGRDQAYHLIENGMKRLSTRDDAELRTADRDRPNTFLKLTTNHRSETERKSRDERQTGGPEPR